MSRRHRWALISPWRFLRCIITLVVGAVGTFSALILVGATIASCISGDGAVVGWEGVIPLGVILFAVLLWPRYPPDKHQYPREFIHRRRRLK